MKNTKNNQTTKTKKTNKTTKTLKAQQNKQVKKAKKWLISVVCLALVALMGFVASSLGLDKFASWLNGSSETPSSETSSNSSPSSLSSSTSSSSSSSPESIYVPDPEVVAKAVDFSRSNEPEELEVFFFQLEHWESQTQVGDSFMIKYGDIEILIDAGEQAVGTQVVAPYMESTVRDGVIELCINTHTDSDHLGGFLGKKVDGAYTGVFSVPHQIQYFIDSGYKATTTLYNNYYTELTKRVESGTKYFTYEETMTSDEAPSMFILGEDTYLQILDTKMYENNFANSNQPNDYSVCALLVHGQKKCLFMGDAEKKAEKALLSYNNVPQVDLFKSNHHGSNTSNSTELLDVIKPSYVIVDSTAKNKHNIPTKEILDRLKTYTPEIYTPFVNGGIHIYLKKDSNSIRFHCDGYKQFENNLKGAIKPGTEGAPIRIHDSDWYKSL